MGGRQLFLHAMLIYIYIAIYIYRLKHIAKANVAQCRQTRINSARIQKQRIQRIT